MRPSLNDFEGSGYSGDHRDVDPNNNFAPAIGSLILLTCAIIATYLVKKKCDIRDVDGLRPENRNIEFSRSSLQIVNREVVMIESRKVPRTSPQRLSTIEEVDEGVESGICRQLKAVGGYIESSV